VLPVTEAWIVLGHDVVDSSVIAAANCHGCPRHSQVVQPAECESHAPGNGSHVF